MAHGGTRVRVVTRSGQILEGTLIDQWPLRNGGVHVSVVDDRRGTVHATTVLPIVTLDVGSEDHPRPEQAGHAS